MSGSARCFATRARTSPVCSFARPSRCRGRCGAQPLPVGWSPSSSPTASRVACRGIATGELVGAVSGRHRTASRCFAPLACRRCRTGRRGLSVASVAESCAGPCRSRRCSGGRCCAAPRDADFLTPTLPARTLGGGAQRPATRRASPVNLVWPPSGGRGLPGMRCGSRVSPRLFDHGTNSQPQAGFLHRRRRRRPPPRRPVATAWAGDAGRQGGTTGGPSAPHQGRSLPIPRGGRRGAPRRAGRGRCRGALRGRRAAVHRPRPLLQGPKAAPQGDGLRASSTPVREMP